MRAGREPKVRSKPDMMRSSNRFPLIRAAVLAPFIQVAERIGTPVEKLLHSARLPSEGMEEAGSEKGTEEFNRARLRSFCVARSPSPQMRITSAGDEWIVLTN